MGFLVFIGAIVLLMVGPIMLLARFFKAKRSGFFYSALAAISVVATGRIADSLTQHDVLAVVLSLLASTLVFSLLLGVPLTHAALITVLTILLQILLLVLFAQIDWPMGMTFEAEFVGDSS